MKWNNKGHEFDELASKLKNLSAIYLFGAGVLGQAVYKSFQNKINIKGFIDNNAAKQNSTICGLPIFSPSGIQLSDNEAIVISTQSAHVKSVTTQLSNIGFTNNVFYMHTFFPVLDYYKFGKICFPSVSFLPTSLCNLKCKHCLNFTPYIKKHLVRSFEQLKQTIDLLFSKVDMLILFHISGGEPFTYPYLSELIEYISENFRNRFGRLEMTTNGTIAPSEKLLAAIKNANIHLIIDDYCDSLSPQYQNKMNELIKKLENFAIDYSILKADYWIDLNPFNTNNSNLSEEQLCKYFDSCDVQRQEYRNGKLYLCNYAAYAEIAEVQKELPPNDYIDLKQITDDNKIELLEFRLGYSNKGYTEFCKRCSGYHNNPYKIKAAEQLS
jgi:organic radical activating enzyme